MQSLAVMHFDDVNYFSNKLANDKDVRRQIHQFLNTN